MIASSGAPPTGDDLAIRLVIVQTDLMTPEAWSRIEAIYHAALELEPAQRVAYLSEACQNETEVRREVESLLAHEGQADRLLEGSAWSGDHSTFPLGTQEPVRPALAAGSEFGIYRIIQRLGAGGMGEVYRAIDVRLRREVAIKVLPAAFSREPERLSRLQREARMLASLNHPCIGAIYGLEESGGIWALVMELLEGPTLADYVGNAPVPLVDSLAIARQIAQALDYAHEKGIVHRDLKPANVKIAPGGTVKVLDFGLARPSQHLATVDLTVAPTEVGLIVGTPGYMAPEQARGDIVDGRADIWAFGVILWEMLAGRRLFEEPTISETLAAVLTREPDLSVVPVEVRGLLRLCLARETRHRLSQISAALMLLEEAEPLRARVARPITRWLWPAASVLLLITSALTFVHYRETTPDPVMIRFQVPLPEKVSFGGHISVSPDGRHVAFSGRGADGLAPIWIHDIDRSDSRPLSGTENGGFFFWSPDSRYLAFSADRQLKKVNTAGGPPQTICFTTAFALGGAWRSDGTIVFGSPDGPLLRVSASGGTPVPITRQDRSTDFNHAFPVFLPGGQHILYHMLSSSREGNAVYVTAFRADGQLERGERLTLSQTGAQYVPGAHGRGRLLLLRGRTLVAQEFDERRLEVLGDAYPLMGQVDSNMTLPFFGSSENGALAWWTGSSDTTSLVWFDRRGNRIGSPLHGQFGELTLTADGTHVAVSESQGDAGGKRDVRVIDLRHGASIRVTFDPRDVGSPVWSPDGKQIAYGSDNLTEIRVVQASAAGREETLPLSPGRKWPVDWSHDGMYLLYSQPSPTTQGDLWVFPIGAPAKDRKPFAYLNSAYRESQGRFSPDGRHVAYVSTETGRPEVYVQQFPAGGGKWRISASGGFQPRWRGDGKELFFLDLARVLMSAAVTTETEFRHAESRRLFDTHESIGIRLDFIGYDVSPDGQRFLVNSAGAVASAGAINVLMNWQPVKR